MADRLWFWDILGIEPTKDKTVIKQAFSKLAHETNPEDDPDGYAKLHDAYKAALKYASGKIIVISGQTPFNTSKRSQFDFTSVKDDTSSYVMNVEEIENEIRNLKLNNNVNSYEELFARPVSELYGVTVNLFKLYAALAIKTDNMMVWNRFFNEPLITIVVEDADMRSFMADYFPEGDVNRTTIKGFADNYENVRAEKIVHQRQAESKEKDLRRRAGKWTCLSIIFTLLAIILVVIAYALHFPNPVPLALGCMPMTFVLSCLSRLTKVYEEESNNKGQFRLSMLLKALVLIFGVIAWTTVLPVYYEAIDFRYYIMLVYIIAFTAADIVLLVTESKHRKH